MSALPLWAVTLVGGVALLLGREDALLFLIAMAAWRIMLQLHQLSVFFRDALHVARQTVEEHTRR